MSADHAATAPVPDHEIVIIGAGLAGLGMAIALDEAGFTDHIVLERADDIGGTWRDNTYPGVAVDIPAQAYQFRLTFQDIFTIKNRHQGATLLKAWLENAICPEWNLISGIVRWKAPSGNILIFMGRIK